MLKVDDIVIRSENGFRDMETGEIGIIKEIRGCAFTDICNKGNKCKGLVALFNSDYEQCSIEMTKYIGSEYENNANYSLYSGKFKRSK